MHALLFMFVYSCRYGTTTELYRKCMLVRRHVAILCFSFNAMAKAAHLVLNCLVEHLGRNTLDGHHWAILACLACVHGHNDILSRSDLAEHRVLRRRGAIKEVQEGIVDSVNEELGSSGVGLAGVGHGKSEWLIGQLGAARVSELIRDRSTSVTLDGLVAARVSRVGGRSTCASLIRVGILGVRAAELNHEVRDGAVHVHSVVEASLDEVDEVGSSDGHLVGKDLDDDYYSEDGRWKERS
jgi:hypothetical protein